MLISDLFMHQNLLRNNSHLKAQMTAMANEMVSGERQSLYKDAPEKLRPISEARQKIARLDAYETLRNEAGLRLEQISLSLSQGQVKLQDFGERFEILRVSGQNTHPSLVLQEAKATMDTLMGALQTKLGGQYLFGGKDGARPPIADADTLLKELKTSISGSETVNDYIGKLDKFFDDQNGPFRTVLTNPQSKGAVMSQLSDNTEVNASVDIYQPEIIGAIKSLAGLIVGIENPEFSAFSENLMDRFGDNYRTHSDGLIALQSSIGVRQNLIENIAGQNTAERAGLELFLSKELSVDTAEAISRFQDAQVQLEALYNVTSRLSQLSLTRFL